MILKLLWSSVYSMIDYNTTIGTATGRSRSSPSIAPTLHMGIPLVATIMMHGQV